jgi:hypothetical protein
MSFFFSLFGAPNVVIEWLTLLRIREDRVQVSGAATGYPEWGLLWFSSREPDEFRDSTLKLGLPNPCLFMTIITL